MLRAYIIYCIIAAVTSIFLALTMNELGMFDTVNYIIVPGIVVTPPPTT